MQCGPAISRRFCTRCCPSALAFLILPKCPVCLSVALLAVGIPIAIPPDLFSFFRGGLLLFPLAYLLAVAGRRVSAVTRACTATLLVSGMLSAAPAGSIHGVVRDSSGGIVTGALVTVASGASGEKRSTRSQPDGTFDVPRLTPGSWTITADAGGFKRVELAGVLVYVDQSTRSDLRLEVGERSELIEVRASAIFTDTDPSSKTTVGLEAIGSLPLNGRQYLDLAVLAAGATPAAPGTQGSGFSVGGIRSQSNVYLLDGASNMDTQTNQPLNLFRITDAVQEFTVQTSVPLPEFGRGSGAQVNVVTKSGTNTIHGSAFEYLRNTVLNASDFFTNKLGGQKSALNRNQFGGSVGGPVRRDRTFFFASYEGFRQSAPSVSSVLVPTEAQRATVTDPIAQRLLAFFPLPNVTGPVNYIGNVRSLDSDDTGLIRVDHRTERDHWSGRWTQYWGTSTAPGPTPLTGGNNGPLRQTSAVFSQEHTFSPRLLNEFRLAESRYTVRRSVQDSNVNAASIFTGADGRALPGVVDSSRDAQNAGLPSITIGGGFAALGSNANFPQGRKSNTVEVFDNGSLLGQGRHSLRWGFHVRREDLSRYLNRAERGSVNFANFADFARAQITTATFRTGSTQSYWRRYPWDIYFQDEFRVRPNFTIHVGLRYEYQSSVTERRGRATNFVPQYGPMLVGTNQVLDIDPSRTGVASIIYRTAPFTLPSSGIYGDRNNFAPMLGFVFAPGSGSTVIRGAGRVAYDDLFNNVPSAMALSAPHNIQTTQTANVTQPGRFAWPLAFNQDVPLVSPTAGVLTFQGVDLNLRNSYAYVYHFGVQRSLREWLVLEADYRGSSGHALGVYLDLNQPTVIVRDSTRRGPVAPNEQVFPYRRFGQAQSASSIGSSNYNGLVLAARGRSRWATSFDASYTFGKSLDYNSSYFGSGNLPGEPGTPIDSRNLRLEHGASAFDVRHRFVARWSVDLPRAGAVVGAWKISGISTVQSGTPFTVVLGGPDTSGFNQSLAGNSPNGGNRPNVVKAGPVPHDNRNPDAAFDPTWFAANLAGQNGSSGRNAYRGPGLQNFDVSAARAFRLRESLSLQLRADFFNVLNRTNFSNPIADLNNANFGRITQTAGSAAATSAGTSGGPVGGARVVQLALRLAF